MRVRPDSLLQCANTQAISAPMMQFGYKNSQPSLLYSLKLSPALWLQTPEAFHRQELISCGIQTNMSLNEEGTRYGQWQYTL